jgi:hypothetical protein
VITAGVSPDYFFDSMSWDEVNAVLDANFSRYKDSWEQTRWIGYINACVAGSSVKKPTDLITFSWEQEEVAVETDTRSIEERRQELIDFTNSIKSE